MNLDLYNAPKRPHVQEANTAGYQADKSTAEAALHYYQLLHHEPINMYCI